MQFFFFSPLLRFFLLHPHFQLNFIFPNVDFHYFSLPFFKFSPAPSFLFRFDHSFIFLNFLWSLPIIYLVFTNMQHAYICQTYLQYLDLTRKFVKIWVNKIVARKKVLENRSEFAKMYHIVLQFMSVIAWFIYQMVIQNMSRIHEGEQVLKKNGLRLHLVVTNALERFLKIRDHCTRARLFLNIHLI